MNKKQMRNRIGVLIIIALAVILWTTLSNAGELEEKITPTQYFIKSAYNCHIIFNGDTVGFIKATIVTSDSGCENCEYVRYEYFDSEQGMYDFINKIKKPY